ncbi:carbohydrate ABC transporter permease [Lacisediminihabitans profunda]|uniref:Carbohydrate ABC transporter permease n=1 Tax=Lacisediminihabitans profunda TaxID=2594790 RepID=A0A5C8USW3_9MICO|nr:carbohydrate ABC transporter permease [Lacisediminihabitans profunda]TXN30980.1 carbohydrate ABC transporter permease [Lacisediminihabitans profunda]
MATKRRGHLLKKTGLLVALSAGAIFAGFPVLWMASSSFKSNTEIFAYPPKLITEHFSFDAYIAILTDPTKVRFFINSYVVAICVTLLTLLVALLAAYAFSRFEFRFKKPLSMLIVSVQAVPPITLLIPFFGLMVVLGLYNTYLGLILTYMVFTLPYAIIMMTGYFNTLPKELDEAARVDGASSMGALWRILVPISVPGIVSVGIYTFMISWNEFLFALTLTRTPDMRTVPIGIQLLMGQNSYEWNQMMAMSILGCIPVLVLFLFFQRFFIGGMTAGAVKN